MSNTQTIASLTINNDGGSNGGNGPTIFTGAGGLTISGTITASAAAETFTIPTLNGFYTLTTGNISVAPNAYVPNQVGLNLTGNLTTPSITLTGGGWLGISGQNFNQATGAANPFAVNVNAGGLAFTPGAGGANALLGGAVILAVNTTFDTRGIGGDIGSLASSAASAQLINGLQGTAGTLTTGLDGTSSTFAGTISSSYPTGLLNITKINGGTWTLTNTSTTTNNGTLTVNGGAVAVSGAAGQISFTSYTLNTGGTLFLDNSVNALNNRLGTPFLTTTIATLSPTVRTVAMQGGNLTINSKAVTTITENLGAMSISGGGIITLNAGGTLGVNLQLQSLSGQGAQTSLFIQGDNLGNAAGANTAAILFATAGAAGTTPGVGVLGAGGANNTLTRSIRSDVLVDNTTTGYIEFMVVDSSSGLVRPLGSGTGITSASELSSTFLTSTAAGTNVSLNSISFGSSTGNTLAAGNFAASYANTVGSLTLQSGGGVNLAIVPTNPFGANGALLTFTDNTTAGVLNLAGSNSIIAGQMAVAGITTDFHVLAGSTLNLNAAITGASGANLVKADGGTLVLNQPYFNTSAGLNVAINGGTLQLGSSVGANALWVYINQGAAPSAETLAINNGTLDLNGNNQLVGTLTSTNPLPYGGATSASPNIIITNTSATAATFYTNAAASVFAGEFQGNLNLDKSGNTAMSLSSPQTYSGTTTIRGGSVVLRDAATLASATINANFAELTIDNTFSQDLTNRVSSTAALNFNGGALRINTTEDKAAENFGTLTLNGGSNLFYINQYSNNGNTSSPTYNFANLVVNNNSTLNLEEPYPTGFGNFTAANAHVYITQLNGVPFNASSMVNGIISPQLVTSNTGNFFTFATYSNTAGISIPGQNGTIALTTATAAGAGAALNQNIGATLQNVVGQTMNSLTFGNPAAGTTLGLNGSLDQLVLASGGLLFSNSANQAIAIQGGSLTAGAVNTASTLYLQAGSRTR